jgi:hypothetical protein
MRFSRLAEVMKEDRNRIADQNYVTHGVAEAALWRTAKPVRHSRP